MQKQKRKTNHIHRAACALLAGLALSLGLLTGCGSDGSTIVVGKKNEKGYSRAEVMVIAMTEKKRYEEVCTCLLYTSPSPRDQRGSRMPSSA